MKSLSQIRSESEAHKRVLRRIKRMSSEELFQWSVKAGVYYPEGGLRPEYGGKERLEKGKETECPRGYEKDDS